MTDTNITKERGRHTPGDWSGEVFEDGAFVIESPDGAVLCQRSSWPSRASESRANGHLMLAAPAMLEALREAEDHMILMYSGIAGGDAEAGQRFADKDPVVAIVRSAIAKAEGKSQ